MGTFLPNGASTSTEGQQGSPSSSSPLYIYETQKLDIEQPKDEDDTVLLDLKLMGPEGSVYAEFSYSFVKENRISRSRSRTGESRTREKKGQTMTPVSSRPEQDMLSPKKDRFERDEFEEDYEEAMKMGGNKGAALDVVTEEPDAGEHLMQATSQFFSRMG